MEHIQMFQSFLIEIYMVSRFAKPSSWEKHGFAGYFGLSACVLRVLCACCDVSMFANITSDATHVCEHDSSQGLP